MWPFTRSKRKLLDKAVAELRDSLENPRVPLSDASAFYSVFGSGMESASGVNVTAENALSVPAIWCAVNFISSTIAALPLILYKKTDAGRERAERDPLYTILHDEVNADCVTSFQWRKYSMTNTLLHGRSVTFIERNKAGRVMNLWPLNPLNTRVERRAGRRFYLYEENGKKFEYRADEVLDIPFMLEADGLRSISPVSRLKNSIGLTLAIEAYASKFFQNGGVPPLALHGPPANAAAINRALTDIVNAVKNASAEKRNVLYMPAGHELKQIGFDPDKNQLTDVRRFQIEEVSRTYNIPPTFLQDLTHGTYSNTEQLDLHFVKHTLTQWVECLESEMNVKLFPARNRTNFVEFNLDGLLRGDFATRMNGFAQGLQHAVFTPNEIREMENRPAKPNGDELLVQGAMISLESAVKGTNIAKQPPTDGNATKQDMQQMQAGEAVK